MTRRIVVLLTLIAGPCSAADHSFLERIDKPYALLIAADGVSTEMMLRRGWYERNPLPGMQSRGGRVLWGVAWTVGVSESQYRLERRGHRGWAKVVRWAGRCAQAALVVHNVRLAHKEPPRQ